MHFFSRMETRQQSFQNDEARGMEARGGSGGREESGDRTGARGEEGYSLLLFVSSGWVIPQLSSTPLARKSSIV